MTVEQGPGASAAPSSLGMKAPFSNLAALRKAHLELRELTAGYTSPPDETAGRIRTFLADACKTGTTLIDPGERRAAQGILDFWSAELAGNPKATEADFVPVVLAPPDAAQGFSQLDSPLPAAEAPASKVDQRSLVRLSAMARQWRDSDTQQGYLLTGDSLKEAAQYKDQDANLAAFVDASKKAIKRRQIIWGGISVIVALITAVVVVWYVRLATQQLRDFIVREATTGSNPGAALWWLDLLQPLSAPYDLSATPRFNKVELPKLRLYAPNFSGVPFSNVKFPAARLPAASFSGSNFSYDGDGSNDFRAAELRQAQFRGARIAKTSFAGADLYRASFDRAQLCDVDFTGANLRFASFWGATFNAKTKDTLKRTAWWQALGWPVERIKELTPANPEEDRQLRNSLKASQGFQYDIKIAIEDIKRSSGGTVERAVALNSFAWTEAIWGIDVSPQEQGNTQANDATAADPCVTTGLPKNADEAARQAICIAVQLNSTGDNKREYGALVSNLRDTLAYILLQNNEPKKALEQYRAIELADSRFLQDPETSFRYAIALYAGGSDPDKDKPAAIEKFTGALQKGLYQPTHELHTLSNYIFKVTELANAVETTSNELWPTVKNLPHCR
jgi:pentapeptide repeat protein